MNIHFLSKVTLSVPICCHLETGGNRLVTVPICGHIEKKKLNSVGARRALSG